METYVNQLIEDIFASIDKAEQTVNQHGEKLEAYGIDEVRYVNEDASETIHTLIEIKEENFPPAGQLSNPQMMGINIALLDCLGCWNIIVDFPEVDFQEKCAPSIVYRSLVKALKNKIVLQHFGVVHIALSLDACETVRYFID